MPSHHTYMPHTHRAVGEEDLFRHVRSIDCPREVFKRHHMTFRENERMSFVSVFLYKSTDDRGDYFVYVPSTKAHIDVLTLVRCNQLYWWNPVSDSDPEEMNAILSDPQVRLFLLLVFSVSGGTENVRTFVRSYVRTCTHMNTCTHEHHVHVDADSHVGEDRFGLPNTQTRCYSA